MHAEHCDILVRFICHSKHNEKSAEFLHLISWIYNKWFIRVQIPNFFLSPYKNAHINQTIRFFQCEKQSSSHVFCQFLSVSHPSHSLRNQFCFFSCFVWALPIALTSSSVKWATSSVPSSKRDLSTGYNHRWYWNEWKENSLFQNSYPNRQTRKIEKKKILTK